MNLDFHIPPFPLGNYIHSVMCYEGYTGNSTFEILLPDGKPQLVITLDDGPRSVIDRLAKPIPLSNSWVTGVFSKPLTYKSEINASTLSIQFKPCGLSRFLEVAASEFTNQVVETELVVGSTILELREKLMYADSFEKRIKIIEAFFLKKMVGIDPQKELAELILNRQTFDEDTLKIWSEDYRYSQKHILSSFKKLTGTTPKKLQTVHRVNKAIALLSQNVPSAQVTYACGFYDQTHFIKKFKDVTSMTPKAYLEAGKSYPHVINLD